MNVSFDHTDNSFGIDFNKIAQDQKNRKGIDQLAQQVKAPPLMDFEGAEVKTSKRSLGGRIIDWIKNFLPSSSQHVLKVENSDAQTAFKEHLINRYGKPLAKELYPDVDQKIKSGKPLSARTVAMVLDKGDALKEPRRQERSLQVATSSSSEVMHDPKKYMPLSEGHADKLYFAFAEQPREVKLSLSGDIKQAVLNPQVRLTGSLEEMKSQANPVTKKAMLAGMFSNPTVFKNFTEKAMILFPVESEKIDRLSPEEKQKLGSDIADALLKKESEENSPIKDEDVRRIINDVFYKALEDHDESPAVKNAPLVQNYSSPEKIKEIINDDNRQQNSFGIQENKFRYVYENAQPNAKKELTEIISDTLKKAGTVLSPEECHEIVLEKSLIWAGNQINKN